MSSSTTHQLGLLLVSFSVITLFAESQVALAPCLRAVMCHAHPTFDPPAFPNLDDGQSCVQRASVAVRTSPEKVGTQSHVWCGHVTRKEAGRGTAQHSM